MVLDGEEAFFEVRWDVLDRDRWCDKGIVER
jgi:hypothetical protein